MWRFWLCAIMCNCVFAESAKPPYATRSSERPIKKVKVVAQVGRLFVYRLPLPACAQPTVFPPWWVIIDYNLMMLIGLPNYDSDWVVGFFCLPTLELILELTVTTRRNRLPSLAFLKIYTRINLRAETVMQKVRFFQIIESRNRNYRILMPRPTMTNMVSLYKYGEKARFDNFVSIDGEVGNVRETINMLLRQDFVEVKGIEFFVHQTILNASRASFLRSREDIRRPRYRRARSTYFPDLPAFYTPPTTHCVNNTPPVAKQASITLTFQTNKFTHVVLDYKLFIDTQDGGTRKLKLQLHWTNGQPITFNDWIQYSVSLQLVYAFADSDVMQRQPSSSGYSLNAVATDSCNASSVMEIFVRIVSNETMKCESLLLVVESLRPPITPVIHLIMEIQQILSILYQNSSDITVMKYERSPSNKVLAILFSAPENGSSLTQIESYFVQTKMPNFIYKSLLRKNCRVNTPPILLYPGETTHLIRDRSATYALLSHMFYDPEDGFLDKLKVIAQHSSDIFTVIDRQALHVYLLKEQPLNFTVTLTVVDLSSVNTSIQLHFISQNHWPVVNRWIAFDAVYVANESWRTVLKYLFDTFGQFTVQPFDMRVLLWNFNVATKRVEFVWSHKSFLDISEFYKTKRQLLHANHTIASSVKQLFQSFFTNVKITYRAEELDQALPAVGSIKNALAPANDHPIAVNKTLFIKVQTNLLFRYQIPKHSFFDRIDGDARHLNLSLYGEKGDVIPKYSWIQFNAATNMLTVLSNHPGKYIFMLTAVNSRGKCSEISLAVTVIRAPTIEHGIEVAITANEYFGSSTPDVEILAHVLRVYKHVVFIRGDDAQVVEHSVARGTPGEVFLTIVHPTAACLGNHATELESAVFNENKKLLVLKLEPKVVVLRVTFSSYDSCEPVPTPLPPLKGKTLRHHQTESHIAPHMSPGILGNITSNTSVINIPGPVVKKKIPRIFVSFCQTLYFYVDPETFYDAQDGNTRHLTIQLLTSADELVTNSSWVQWRRHQQCIYGVLKLSDYNPNGQTFKLRATDSDGFYVQTEVRFIFSLSAIQHHYQVETILRKTVRIDPIDINEQIDFKRKVEDFLNVKQMHILDYRKLGENRLKMTWFLCDMYETPCPLKEIEGVRERLENAQNINPAFSESMLREYIILTTSLRLLESCTGQSTVYPTSYIPSTNAPTTPSTRPTTSAIAATPNIPPMVLKTIPILWSKPCQGFVHALDEDTFFDVEDGLTRNLKIVISQRDSKHADLHFNATTQTFSGKLSDSKEARFRVVATDSNGLSVEQTMIVHPATQTRVYLITTNGFISIPKSGSFVKEYLIQKLEALLQYEFSGMLVNVKLYTVNISASNEITVQWYVCKLPCSEKNSKVLRDMMYKIDGRLTQRYATILTPYGRMTTARLQKCTSSVLTPAPLLATFSENMMTAKAGYLQDNSPPRSQALIPMLVARTCAPFNYHIPEKTCFDAQQGFTPNLNLQLLRGDFKRPRPDSWIRLNTTAQTLHGVLRISDAERADSGMVSYYLKCTDSQGEHAMVKFSILLLKERVEPSYLITFFTYMHSMERDSEVRIVKRLAEYLKDPYIDNIRIHAFTTSINPSSQIMFTWYNCSIVDPCSREADVLKAKLFDDTLNLNFELTQAMVAEFVMISGLFNTSQTCETLQTTATTTSKNTVPIVKTPLIALNIPLCSTFSFRVPENAFYDAEDGNTRNLRLRLLTSDYREVPKTLSVQFVEETQVIYGHARASDLQMSESVKIFYIQATDKNGASVYSKVQLNLPRKPNVLLTVNMTLSRFFDLNTTDLVTQIFLTSQISSYMGDADVSKMLVIDFIRTRAEVFLTWGNCTLLECIPREISYMRTQLLEGPNTPSIKLQEYIKPYYSVDGIFLKVNQTCILPTTMPTTTTTLKTTTTSTTPTTQINRRPRLTREIPPFEINDCDWFEYTIPDDVFLDEDGGTSSLSLTLLHTNGELVAESHWLKLTDATVSGMPLQRDLMQQPSRGYRYLIKATDSGGLYVTLLLTFKRIPFEVDQGYLVSLKLRLINSHRDNPEKQIVERLNEYLGRRVKVIDAMQVEHVNFIFTWTGCEMNVTSCPLMKINRLKESIYERSGNIRGEFRQLFYPDYLIIAEIHKRKPCPESEVTTPLPTVATTEGILPLISVTATFCKSLSYTIPRHIADDGRNLSLHYVNGSRVGCDSWVQLGSGTNTITAVPLLSENQTSTYILRVLSANRGQSVSTLSLTVEQPAHNFQYRVAFSLKSTLNASVCRTSILDTLRSKLSLYLRVNNLAVLEFAKRGSKLFLMVGFCVEERMGCDYELVRKISRLLYEGDTRQPKVKLVYALHPEFHAVYILDELTGACAHRKALVIHNDLLTPCVPPCGLYEASISLNNSDGKFVREIENVNGNAWIQFEETGFRVLALPTEAIIKHQASFVTMTTYHYNGKVERTYLHLNFCMMPVKYYISVKVKLKCGREGVTSYHDRTSVAEHLSQIYFDGRLSSMYIIDFAIEGYFDTVTFTKCSNTSDGFSLKPLNGARINKCLVNETTMSDVKDYPPLSNVTFVRFVPVFCKINTFPLRHLFYDREDSREDLSLHVTFMNQTSIPLSLWLALNGGELIVMLTKTLSQSKVYEFLLVATDSSAQTATVKIIIDLYETFPPINYVIELTYVPFTEVSTVEQITNFFHKLNLFLQRQHSFAVVKYNVTATKVHASFGICSLEADRCDYDEIAYITKTLGIDAGKTTPNPELVNAMFPACYIETITDQRMGSCFLDYNSSPVLVHAMPDIVLPLTGYLRFRVPGNTFYDKEDGWNRNLTLQMKFFEGCWIELDATTQTVLVVASNKVFEEFPDMKVGLWIAATDRRKEKWANSTFTLTLNPPQPSSFSLSIIFQVTFNELPCVKEKHDILMLLEEWFNTSLILQSAFRSADDTFIEVIVSYSSVRYSPCNYILMDRFLSTVQKNQVELKQNFVDFMQPEYTPRFVSLQRERPCHENNPPKRNGSLYLYNIRTNFVYKSQLRDLVYDLEDGDALNLKLTLYNATSGFKVRGSDWIYFNESDKTLYILGSRQAALRQTQQGYKFFFRVEDSRQASVTITFTVKFRPIARTKTFVVSENMVVPSREGVVPTLINWKLAQERFLGLQIDILSYSIVDILTRSFSRLKVDITWAIYQQTNDCNFIALSKVKHFYKRTTDVAEFTIKKYGQCLEKQPLPPVAMKDLKITVDPCRNISYTLPVNLFEFDSNNGSSELTVTATPFHPQLLKSEITYNIIAQTFTGVISTEDFKSSGFIEYVLVATDSNQLQANTSLKFKLKNATGESVYIHMQMYYYTSEKSPSDFFVTFRKKFLEYMNAEGVVIHRYNVTLKPICSYTVVLSTCPKSTEECLTPDYIQTKDLLLTVSGDVNAKFFQVFLPTIVVTSVSVVKPAKCKNKAPTIGKHINNLTASVCRYLEFVVPENAFLDEEDGTNLQMIFTNLCESWMRYDNNTRTLYATPTINEYRSQSEQGYVVTLTATDSEGEKAVQNVTIFVEYYHANYILQLTLFATGVTHGNQYSLINDLNAEFGSSIRVYKISVFSDQLVQISVVDCSANQQTCDKEKNKNLLAAFQVESLSGKYNLIAVKEKTMNECQRGYPPKVTGVVPVLNLTFCEVLNYRLPENLFVDYEDGMLDKESVQLLNVDGTDLSNDSFVRLEQTTNRIYGLITRERNYPIGEFLLQATDTDGETVNLTIAFQMPPKEENKFAITTTVKTIKNTSNNSTDVIVLITFHERMSAFFEGHPISMVSYTRSTNAMEITWIVCLSNQSCANINSLHDKIFTNHTEARQSFAQALEGSFQHLKSTFKSPCRNQPPIANRNVTITLATRNYFNLTLSDDLFTDDQPGLQLTMSFTNSSLIPPDHWLQLNDRTVYGFPNDEAVTQRSMLYIVSAEDQEGESALSWLTVEIQVDERIEESRASQIEVIANCSKANRTLVYKVLQITTRLSNVSTVPLEEIYLHDMSEDENKIRFVLSLNRTIDIAQLQHGLEQKIISECFLRKIETFKPTALPSSQPRVINGISDVTFICGMPLKYVVPEESFFDDEDGSTRDLSLHLLDANAKQFEQSKHIYFDAKSQTLYAFYSQRDCLRAPDEIVVGLRASNARGLFAIDFFKLVKEADHLHCCVKITLTFPYTIDAEFNLKTYSMLKNEIYVGTAVELRIVSAEWRVNDTYNVTITDQSLTNETCWKNKTKTFNDVLQSTNYSLPGLLGAFTEYCNSTSSPEVLPILNPPVAGRFISSEEWFLYLLPVFILAFMLCMTCIFFYVCRFCYKCCCRPETTRKLLVEEDTNSMESAIDAAPNQSLYADIPVEIPEIKIEPAVILPVKAKPSPPGWDIPSKTSSVIIPKKIEEELKSLSFHTSLLSAEADPTNEEKITELQVERPRDLMYAKPRRPRKVYQVGQASRKANLKFPKAKRDLPYTVATKGPLRLPALPTGPPPPYSPPRRQRVFSRNVIPNYYEKYTQRKRTDSPFLVPIQETVTRSPLKRSNSAHKRKKLQLPIIQKLKTKRDAQKKYEPLVVQLPELSRSYTDYTHSPQSDVSVEIPAILKGKKRSVKKILNSPASYMRRSKHSPAISSGRRNRRVQQYLDAMSNETLPSEESSWKALRRKSAAVDLRRLYSRRPIRHKFSKPFLYDYLPVRRKNSPHKHKVNKQDQFYIDSKENRPNEQTNGPYGTRRLKSKYLDSLSDISELSYEGRHTGSKGNSDEVDRRGKTRTARLPSRRKNLDEILEDSF